MSTREPIYVALANLVFNDSRVTSLFVTTGRLLAHVDDMSADQCPALFMFQLPETRVYKGKGIPPIRTLHVAFLAYFVTLAANGALPATALNGAADVIDDIISTPGNPQNTQTLGGLVEHVYIEPAIEPYEGLLQEKSVLVAKVAILIP